MKKIAFGAKRPSEHGKGSLDNWVSGSPPAAQEKMKRLTIDVPLGLHKRIKSQCALQSLVMADEIRALLEQRWPAAPEVQHSTTLQDKAPS